ncbi:MAG TPA: hypothetical protein VFX43_07905 [Chitinophagaceae bacterium]|nr:hypothetical protein [Chitinophagaceae bacterium]
MSRVGIFCPEPELELKLDKQVVLHGTVSDERSSPEGMFIGKCILIGDGTITPISDYTIIGNPYPRFSYGLTNMLQYKGLTLRVTKIILFASLKPAHYIHLVNH